MMMKTAIQFLGATLLALLAVNPTAKAQTLMADLEKMQAYYTNEQSQEIELVVTLFADDNGRMVDQQQSAQLMRDGTRFRYTLGPTTMVFTPEWSLIANEGDQQVYFKQNKNPKTIRKAIEQFVPNLASEDAMPDSTWMLERTDSLVTYRLYAPSAEIEDTRLTLNHVTGQLVQVTYHYNPALKHINPVVSVRYNHRPLANQGDEAFALEQFIARKNGLWTAVGDYASYEVILDSND